MLVSSSIQLPISLILMITIEMKSIGRVTTLIVCLIIPILFSGFAILDPFYWSYYLSIGIVYGFCDGIIFVLYPYTCELYNTEIRTSALSLVNIVSRVLCLESPSLFLFLFDIYPSSVFIMIITSSILAIILILVLKVETKGKVLDSI